MIQIQIHCYLSMKIMVKANKRKRYVFISLCQHENLTRDNRIPGLPPHDCPVIDHYGQTEYFCN